MRDGGLLELRTNAGDIVQNVLNNYFGDTGEWTGFVNRSDSEIIWDDVTKIFTIQPKAPATSYVVWLRGSRTTKYASEAIDVSGTINEGKHYFYFDGGTGVLSATDTFTEDLITQHAWIATLYWDSTNLKQIYLGEERHGLVMDGATHLHLHRSLGTRWVNGLSLENLTVGGNGSFDFHAQFGLANGEIRDEDISLAIIDGSPQVLSRPAEIPIYYKSGAAGDWRRRPVGGAADVFPIIYNGDGSGYAGLQPPYNENVGGVWQLTNIGNNYYVLMHYFATNDVNYPIVGIVGRYNYTAPIDAVEDAETELREIILGGLPFEEHTPLATVLFTGNQGMANTPNAAAVAIDEYQDYISWLGSGYGPASAPFIIEQHYPPNFIDGFETDSSGGVGAAIQGGSCRDSTNRINLDLKVSINLVITTSGPGGLDTGARVPSTWYYMYVIYNEATKTYSGVFSANKTTPTLSGGYTWYRRVGSVFNRSDNTLRAFSQEGLGRERDVKYYGDDIPQILANGLNVGPVWGSVNSNNGLPDTASRAKLMVRNGSATPGAIAELQSVGAGPSSNPLMVIPPGLNQEGWQNDSGFPVLFGNSNLWYRYNIAPGATGLDIYCGGYTEQI